MSQRHAVQIPPLTPRYYHKTRLSFCKAIPFQFKSLSAEQDDGRLLRTFELLIKRMGKLALLLVVMYMIDRLRKFHGS
jgi:hypothetical protein